VAPVIALNVCIAATTLFLLWVIWSNRRR